MLVASDIRLNHILKIEGKTCRVLFFEMKGTGKFGKTVHLRIKVIEDGHVMEKSYRAEEKVDEVEVHTMKLQYLYKETDGFVFMNNVTFDQFTIPAKTIGRQEIFLKENAEISGIFEGEKPLAIEFPRTVDLLVTSAPAGTKGQGDHTYKEIELENGLKILAPQFVKVGESVRVDTESLTYTERVTVRSMKPGEVSL